MNSTQQSLARFSSHSPFAGAEMRMTVDEDVALGCECADPALQIDCWGEQAGELGPERD
jgi:hypothetical protein